MNPKVAIVTGGASGMGRRWSERMARAGVRVAALDRDEAGLATLASNNPYVRVFPSDVTDLPALRKIVDEVEESLGPVERVVHAAGIMPGALILDEDPERTKRVMRINYEGTINIVHAALPRMIARKSGELVCFGSVAGEALTPRLGAYCASKAAVNAYVEILAREVRGSGVTVHLVCPPMVDTPLLQQSMSTDGPKSLRQAIDEKMLAKPDEIVDAIEKALAKKAPVSHPLMTSKVLSFMRRMAPGLLWTVIERSEEAMAGKA